MISISPTDYDILGGLRWRRLEAGTDIERGDRRVSRRALLDVTVSIYDAGYTDGDRTLTAVVRPTLAEIDRVREIIEQYNRVHVSVRDGFYRAALESWRYDPPNLQIKLMIETKLSA